MVTLSVFPDLGARRKPQQTGFPSRAVIAIGPRSENPLQILPLFC
jgi:hypothetical protein